MDDKECIVHKCTNRTSQGKFIGFMCLPCHQIITTGVVGPTESFIGELHQKAQIHDELVKYFNDRRHTST